MALFFIKSKKMNNYWYLKKYSHYIFNLLINKNNNLNIGENNAKS